MGGHSLISFLNVQCLSARDGKSGAERFPPNLLFHNASHLVAIHTAHLRLHSVSKENGILEAEYVPPTAVLAVAKMLII